MFALEMKTRKMVHDLVAPLLEKMNVERQKMTVTNDRSQQLEDRVTQVEHVCDVHGNKPKVFQLIKNEFAEVKEQQVYIETRLQQKLDLSNMKMELQQEEIKKFDLLAQILTSKADTLDIFSREIKANLANMNERLQGDIFDTKTDFQHSIRLTLTEVKQMEMQLSAS